MPALQSNPVEPMTNNLLRQRPLRVRRMPMSRRSDVLHELPEIKPALRVLIVDACQDTVNSMAALLDLWGFDNAKAYCTQDALAQAAAYRPHVVLLDTSMHGGHEKALVNLVRTLPILMNALLIAVTGNARQVHRLACQQAGIDYFFLKPVRPASIQDILNDEQLCLLAPTSPFAIGPCAVFTNIGMGYHRLS
jgi:CheY-like chemotaxis protein